MPRDSNGNYTLPDGNPVQDGFTIATAWANPTMDDLAAEIQDSLSRSGKGAMLATLETLAINASGDIVSSTNISASGAFSGDSSGTLALPTGQTTARSLADWVADASNAKGSGATGNGVADDTTGLDAANTAAGLLRGVLLLTPTAGGYRYAGTLTLSEWITLSGLSGGSFILWDNPSGNGDLRLQLNSRVLNMRLNFAGVQGAYFTDNATDARVVGNDLNSTPNRTIHINLARAGLERMFILQNISKDAGYGLLVASGATGGDLITGDYIARDAFDDPFAINDVDRSFPGIIATRMLLSCDPVGSSNPSSGFGLSLAAVHRVIIGDFIIDKHRQEAIHIEDANEAVLIHDAILDECATDGIDFYNRRWKTFDANTAVDLTANTIDLAGTGLEAKSKLMTQEPIIYNVLGGTAIGGLVNLTTYYAIRVDDTKIQVAATPGGAAIDLTTKPASETQQFQVYTRGMLINNVWIRKEDEARTNVGFNLWETSNESIHDSLASNVYVRGFETGFDFQESRGIAARNLFAANCDIGVSLDSRANWSNDIDGVILRDCDTGVKNTKISKVGHVSFIDVPTLWDATGANAGEGLSFTRGHSGELVWSHPGGGTQVTNLFPAGANDRAKATMTVRALPVGGSSSTFMLISDFLWDGTTLTKTEVDRVTGAFAAPTLIVAAGQLQIQVFSNATFELEVYWDLVGMHYVET